MARLNEPPAAPQSSSSSSTTAENTEALKRRFLRQNRELAKNNSQQSVRIRSLENDCSRLLAENLSLREHVLQLQNTAASRSASDYIDSVTMQLEAKVQEMNELVAGLAQLRRKGNNTVRSSRTTSIRQSGEQRQWPSGLGLQEVENGMLPTIVEDKIFSTRTRGTDQIRQVLEGPEDLSPDIGPPPVLRYENEDPLSANPHPISIHLLGENFEDEKPALSINLKTRKKYKENDSQLGTHHASVYELTEEPEGETNKSLRTGAKRKFSIQGGEDEDSSREQLFAFNRRNTAATPNESVGKDSNSASPKRSVLGSKPVNTDPVVSPKKHRSSVKEKTERNNPSSLKLRGHGRINITRNFTESEFSLSQTPELIDTAEIDLDSLPPVTPAIQAAFSPLSTEPPLQRPDKKDTPPPGDFASSGQAAQVERAGRRARPKVSYKEPSLHKKMRRPDAKLVDAVMESRKSIESRTDLSVATKCETVENLSWKSISNAPNRCGEEEGEGGSPLKQKVDRRDTSHDVKTAHSHQPEERSTASKAISALINESSAAKRKMASSPISSALDAASPRSHDRINSETETPVIQEGDDLAIFDFPDSISADPSRPRIADLAKASRGARRHSSVPTSSALTSSLADRRTKKAEKTNTSVRKRSGAESAKSTNSVNLSKGADALCPVKGTSAPRLSAREKNLVSDAVLTNNTCTDANPSTIAGVSQNESGTESVMISTLRAERIASRRKSMML